MRQLRRGHTIKMLNSNRYEFIKKVSDVIFVIVLANQKGSSKLSGAI